jgi:hypothetical protein
LWETKGGRVARKARCVADAIDAKVNSVAVAPCHVLVGIGPEGGRRHNSP